MCLYFLIQTAGFVARITFINYSDFTTSSVCKSPSAYLFLSSSLVNVTELSTEKNKQGILYQNVWLVRG